MIRHARGNLTVSSRLLGILALTGAASVLALAGCSSSSSSNPDSSAAKPDTATALPDLGPDLPVVTGGAGGAAGVGGAGGAGGTMGMDASVDRTSVGGTGGSPDAAPDLAPAKVDGPAVEAGATDVPVDGPSADRPLPNLDVPAGEAGGNQSDGGGEEAGTGACPSPVYAWSYGVSGIPTVAWDTDDTLVTGGAFFSTTTSFGGEAITNAGSADMLVAKLDPATGNAKWVFTAGDSNDQYTNNVAVTSGNLAVVGNFTGTLDIDPINGVIPPIVNTGTTFIDFIVGLKDSDGTGVWSKKVNLGGGHLNALAGNPGLDYFLVCGAAMNSAANLAATGTAGGGKDVVVAAVKASDGTVMWAKLFGGAMDQACTSAALDDSGNAYFAGTYAGTLDFGLGPLTPAPTGAYDQIAWVAKLNGADGTTLAAKAFGTSGIVDPTAMAIDPQGAVVLAGQIQTAVVFGSQTLTPVGSADAFVVKLDPATLAPTWARNMGGKSAGCTGVAADSAGGITVVGSYSKSLSVGPGGTTLQAVALTNETFVVTLDGSSGQTLCAHRYGDAAGSNGALWIAINRGATGVNKDRAAIGGTFSEVIDFGPPTTALSSVVPQGTTNGSTNGYLLEM
ncbi:MAG: hypothetical protein WBP56_16860 [Polyangia bacterium]